MPPSWKVGRETKQEHGILVEYKRGKFMCYTQELGSCCCRWQFPAPIFVDSQIHV